MEISIGKKVDPENRLLDSIFLPFVKKARDYLESSHFCATYAMSFNYLLLLNSTTKVNQIIDMENIEQQKVASCSGIY